ncbi:MAG TPA: proline--tRNA ligase [Candidatus Acidoferrales bacterium]|nr:proline--tRNA ligase [Candidatus Acidoferrales bacterium]
MHRWSELFIPTLREAPADAEVASHKFLVRAGYIRQLAAGIYSYLFLGNRSFNKIIAIVRQEMDRIGQEFYLPSLHPREVWEASGRWAQIGDNMFRLKDRKGGDMCLGFTEEEVMTSIALKELRSYKQLPQIWYQIAPKFRDEPRPKSGLLRVRQFIMKDSYSFDMDAAGLDVSYKKHYEAYCRIFDRCGLKYMVVEADSGAMGGKESHEFMVRTPAGEDQIVSCDGCKYAANMEKATSKPDAVEDLKPEGDGKPLLVHTPGKGAIADVAEFLKVSPKQDIKAVAYMAQKTSDDGRKKLEQPVVAFLRGDHTVNETKLLGLLKASELRPMQAEELERYFQGPAGYIGPIGLVARPRDLLAVWLDSGKGATRKEYPQFAANIDNPRSMNVVLDSALVGRSNMICGANKLDYHFKNVTPGKDFEFTISADIRNVEAGEACPNCGRLLRIDTAVEIGHIFKLGYRYSESMGARVLDQNGKEVTPIMGSYGIGIERILTAAVEQGNDEDGFWLPASIAPFEVVVSPVNMKDQAVKSAAEDIAQRLAAAGFDVILDDRDERPGVKFKDADLVGIPFRVTVGKKVTEGTVEVVQRSTGEVRDVTITAIVEHCQRLLGRAG